MQRWLERGTPRGQPSPVLGAIYNLTARCSPKAGHAVLYLMLPPIAIIELLKLIPPRSRARRCRSIEVNYSLRARPGTKRAVTICLPIKKSRKRAFTVISKERGINGHPWDHPLTASLSICIHARFSARTLPLFRISEDCPELLFVVT